MELCWNITSRCNKNCKYCFKFNKSDLSLEENKKILHNLIKRNVTKITWSGGEPFLYKDLKELLKISKEHNILNYVITNTTLLDENIIKENIEYIDRLVVSLDFIDDSLNAKYEIGKNYFKHLKDVLKMVKRIKPSIEIKVNTVVFKGNLNFLEDLYQELLNYDIDFWKLIRFFPIRGKSLQENRLGVTDEEFQDVIEQFGHRHQKFDIVIHNLEEMKQRHIIVLSSGELIYSEGGADIESGEKLL